MDLSPSFPIDGGTVTVCTAATRLQKPQCFDTFRDGNFGKNRTVLFCIKKFTKNHKKFTKNPGKIRKNSDYI